MSSPECSEDVHLDEVASFLSSLFPLVKVKLLPTVFSAAKGSSRQRIARYLATSRIRDVSKPHETSEPMAGEVDYELRVLDGEARPGGVVYDARRFEELLISLQRKGNRLENATVVMTDRLVSTYSRDDLRHHLRTVIPGFPSIISVPGMVEAPAKPRQYYLLRQRLGSIGAEEGGTELLRSAFKGRFLEYGSPEMTEVAKGLGLQAVIHHLTLAPFCPRKRCRLFNAHWQEDLLNSQSGSPGLCSKHLRLIGQLGRDPVLNW